MRIAVTALLALFLGFAAYARWVGIEPKDRRPGTLLAGEVSDLPRDWRMVDTVGEVQVETHPWWGIPYSVTVVIARDGEDLYTPSIYSKPGEFPGTKLWNRIIADNPNVRLRIGKRLYELRLEPVQSEAEHARGLAALARKYPFWQEVEEDPARLPGFAILRYAPR